jgi:hypothetical protein
MRAGTGTTVPTGGGRRGLRDRLGIGLRLAGRSLAVLRSAPRLLVFPVAAALGVVAFLAVALGGVVVADGVESPPLAAALVALALGGRAVLTTLSNAALVHATREVFEGRDPDLWASVRAALARWPQLLAWAVLSAVVGSVLRGLEESSGVAGDAVAGLLSIGWAALTYFVVPVVVFEDAPMRTMVQDSGRLFRETWGETVGVEFGVGVVAVLLVLPGVLVGAVGFWLASTPAARGLAVLVGLLVAVPGLLAGVTLGDVAKVALYRYARDGEAPPAFADLALFE